MTNRVVNSRRAQQTDMIHHQYPSMQVHLKLFRTRLQPIGVGLKIQLTSTAHVPIIPTLNYMLGYHLDTLAVSSPSFTQSKSLQL